MAKDHGSQIKDDDTYEALRKEGASKEKAARIANAQAAGTIPVDVGELGVDFYTVSAQKWLLGPAATGALYVAPGRLDECRVACPSYFSWKLPDYELKDTAVRFEGSWTPPASVAGLLASFVFAAEAGEERFARAGEAAARCRARRR